MKTKKKVTKRTKIDWSSGVAQFSVRKATEGGMGREYAAFLLKEAKIPFQFGGSAYVGDFGIMIPERYERRASKVLFG